MIKWGFSINLKRPFVSGGLGASSFEMPHKNDKCPSPPSWGRQVLFLFKVGVGNTGCALFKQKSERPAWGCAGQRPGQGRSSGDKDAAAAGIQGQPVGAATRAPGATGTRGKAPGPPLLGPLRIRRPRRPRVFVKDQMRAITISSRKCDAA
jgi:hypothetical protein